MTVALQRGQHRRRGGVSTKYLELNRTTPLGSRNEIRGNILASVRPYLVVQARLRSPPPTGVSPFAPLKLASVISAP